MGYTLLLSKSDAGRLTALVLGRKLPVDALVFAQVATADRGAAPRDDLFELLLGDILQRMLSAAYRLVELLARCRLHDIVDVAAVVALRHVGKPVHVYVLFPWQLGQFQGKQTLAGLVVGHVHIDQFVDASRPQHGLVDALGMVGGGKDIDPFVGSMVEHTEKLVHLAVVVLVVFVSCATRHHGVKLVKEEQCRRVSLRILEDLADLLLRAVHHGAGQIVRDDLDKVDANLLSHFLGKERLATSRRPIEEHGGRTDAVGVGQITMLEHIDEALLDPLLQVLHAGNVAKAIAMLLGRRLRLGPGLAA